jgi:hypothetical protein
MTFTDGTTTYTVFEPQCDSWDGHQLVARSAVAVQPAGQSQPTYGVIGFNAITLVDKSSHTATLADFKLTSADFPSARDQTQSYVPPVVLNVSQHAPPIALDHLENSLTFAEAPKPEQLNNTPPKIIIALRPAVLVYLDGPPAWRPVAGAPFQRAINTRVLLLKDQSGNYYLHLFDGYLQATSLDGLWTVAHRTPAGIAVAEKEALDSGQVDLMRGEADPTTHEEPSLSRTTIPDVHVATTPTELITFTGPPEYVAIPGTDLLYAENTSGNVFKLLTDQQNYVLISGRWYRASSLDGPWQFVPGNKLPPAFANIPDNSPKENVKASVPGTQQAEEALIANSIPQSAAVARSTPMPAPQIDGAMQLAPIEGTPLHYVANSSTPIIEVDPQSWYACQDGIWYASTTADGPWMVAASVPAVIYSIPPSSPLHYVTYVQVYGSTPNTVYEGYTPGYFGTEIGDDGTVVYGTGYDYTPWIGGVWYGPPITWGCGFDDCWTPWWGWGFDCGFGWGWGWGWFGCYPAFPWWGGYRCWHDFHGDGWRDADRGDLANTGADFYRNHDGFGDRRQFAGNGVHGFDRNGWSEDYGRAYNSRTGLLTGGQAGRVQQVSGSAWNPGHQSGWTQGSRGAFANGGGWRGGAFNSGRSWASSAPRQQWSSGYRSANVAPLYRGPSRIASSPRGFQYNSSSAWHGGGDFNNGARSGGSFFHSGGGGFHGGGGGGGGFHGGGGGGGGGGRR